jgi:hypothetical protein
MPTTQAFRNALHVPYADPGTAQVVTTLTPGDLYQTTWAAGAAGSAFPDQTGPNQFLCTDPNSPYVWKVIDTIDCGTF